MPVYEYECTSCKKNFSITQMIKEHDQAKVSCPECGSTKVEQLISSFFAKTDRKS